MSVGDTYNANEERVVFNPFKLFWAWFISPNTTVHDDNQAFITWLLRANCFNPTDEQGVNEYRYQRCCGDDLLVKALRTEYGYEIIDFRYDTQGGE